MQSLDSQPQVAKDLSEEQERAIRDNNQDASQATDRHNRSVPYAWPLSNLRPLTQVLTKSVRSQRHAVKDLMKGEELKPHNVGQYTGPAIGRRNE